MKNDNDHERLVKGFITALLIIAIIIMTALAVKAETIDSTGYWLELVIDRNKVLHLSYSKAGAVYYRTSKNWSKQFEVPGSQETYYSRLSSHIAVDFSGNAHFSWCNNSLTKVYYNEYRKNHGFTGLKVAIYDQYQGADTCRNDIFIDNNNKICIVAQNDFSIALNCKENGVFDSNYTKLCYDDPNEPKNCFASRNLVVYQYKGMLFGNILNSGFWSSYFVIDADMWVANSDIFVKQNNDAHIAWIIWRKNGFENSDLIYKQQINGIWQNKEILFSIPNYFDCPQTECAIPQVVVADNGTILIMFADGKGNIKTAIKKTNAWNITHYANGHFPALALDGNLVHIVYANDDKMHYDIMDLGGGGLITPTPSQTRIPANTSTPTLTQTETPTFTPEPTETVIEPTYTHTATISIQPTPEPTIKPPIPDPPPAICGHLGGFFLLMISLTLSIAVIKKGLNVL